MKSEHAAVADGDEQNRWEPDDVIEFEDIINLRDRGQERLDRARLWEEFFARNEHVIERPRRNIEDIRPNPIVPDVVADIPDVVPDINLGGPADNVVADNEAGDVVADNANGAVNGGPPAPAKAALSKEAQKKAAKAQAQLFGALKAIGGEAMGLYNSAMKIAGITATAERMLTASSDILSATSTSVGKSFATVGVEGLDVVTGGSQAWDELEIAIEAIFETTPALKDVQGSIAYKTEICRLVVYGRALCEAKLAVAQAASALAEAKARRLAEENAVAILGKRLKQIDGLKLKEVQMAELNFGRVLDAKRTTWIAMEAYRRAFQYFTLADEKSLPVLPPLTAPVDKYSSEVRNIMSRELQSEALSRHGGKPQKMSPKIVLNDEELLASLKSDHAASFEIHADSKAFAGFGRVRFDSVRLFLEGLDTDGKIAIDVVTTGVYEDKAPGTANRGAAYQTRKFVTQGLRETFVYDAQDRSDMPFKIELADRFKNDFFKPTPFTIWSVRVRRYADERPLDLSGITGLKLEFDGERTSL